MSTLLYCLIAALALQCHAQVSTTSSQICTTKYGSSSVANPVTTTGTTSKTNTVTAKTTFTPSTTVTKATPTVTQTTTTTVSISKTIPSTKGTVTSTTTQTATTTNTVTSYVTTSVTSTTDAGTTYTSTVPTPAGFVPLAQESGYVPKIKGRSPDADARELIAPRQATDAPTPSSYPTATSCNLITQVYSTTVSTVTAKNTKTITSTPNAQTATKTVTKTTTITFDGRSTTTQTATTTVPATTTTTGTITTTNTVVIATPATFYAACDANNIVSTANGHHNISRSQWAYDSSLRFAQVSPITPYECCNLCQRTTGCQWTTHDGLQYCIYVIRDTCNPGTPYTVPNGQYGTIDIFYTSAEEQDSPLLLGNGPCGAISNGGDYPEQSAT